MSLLINVAGLGLIALIVWWFWLSYETSDSLLRLPIRR